MSAVKVASHLQPSVLYWICLCAAALPEFATARQVYTSKDGALCYKCPPGTRVEEDCKADPHVTAPLEPTCIPCQPFSYSSQENDKTSCQPCHPGNCLKFQEEVQACTNTTNRLCRCIDGYHEVQLDAIEQQVPCEPHTKCGSRQGEVYPGNSTQDTKCRTCEEGKEFVNVTNPLHPKCQTCSMCPTGNIVVENCSLLQDTGCKNSSTFDQGGQSQELGAAAIIGIVYACQLLITVVMGAVVIFCENKSTSNIKQQFWTRAKIAIGVLAFLPGVGVIFWTILVFKITLRFRTNQRKVGRKVYTVFSGDGTRQAQPQGSSGHGRVSSSRNGDAASADTTSWSKRFIKTVVFNHLCKNLGFEWERFMCLLPDFEGVNIDQKKAENRNSVADQIHACLKAWYQQSPSQVTQENICEALENLQLREIIETLKQKHEAYLLRS